MSPILCPSPALTSPTHATAILDWFVVTAIVIVGGLLNISRESCCVLIEPVSRVQLVHISVFHIYHLFKPLKIYLLSTKLYLIIDHQVQTAQHCRQI